MPISQNQTQINEITSQILSLTSELSSAKFGRKRQIKVAINKLNKTLKSLKNLELATHGIDNTADISTAVASGVSNLAQVATSYIGMTSNRDNNAHSERLQAGRGKQIDSIFNPIDNTSAPYSDPNKKKNNMLIIVVVSVVAFLIIKK